MWPFAFPPFQTTSGDSGFAGIRKTVTSLAPKADPRSVLGLETDPSKRFYGFSKTNELYAPAPAFKLQLEFGAGHGVPLDRL